MLISRVWRWAPFVVLLIVLGAVAGWASTINDRPTYTTRAALTVLSQDRAPDQDAILSQGYADFFNTDVYQTKLRHAAGVRSDVTFEARTALASPILYVTATSYNKSAVTSAASAMASALRTQVNSAIDQTHQEEIDAALDAFGRLHRQEPNVPDQALLDLNCGGLGSLADSSNKLQTVQLESFDLDQHPEQDQADRARSGGRSVPRHHGRAVLGGLTPRIRSTTDVERALGEPPLAVLPRRADSAEAALLWTTITRLEPPVGSVLAVTHAHSRERTQDVAQQLARAASRSGTGCCSNGALPLLATSWGSRTTSRTIGWHQRRGPAGRAQSVEVSYGTVHGDPYSVMSSSRAKEMLELLRGSFQAVVVATPGLLETAEGPVACTLADATLVAIDQRRSRSTEVIEAVGDLQALNVRIAGSALLLEQRGRQASSGGRAAPPGG